MKDRFNHFDSKSKKNIFRSKSDQFMGKQVDTFLNSNLKPSGGTTQGPHMNVSCKVKIGHLDR